MYGGTVFLLFFFNESSRVAGLFIPEKGVNFMNARSRELLVENRFFGLGQKQKQKGTLAQYLLVPPPPLHIHNWILWGSF